MSSLEDDVRLAAAKLQETIAAAIAGGYTVAWPEGREGLSAIAISATAKVEGPAAKPDTSDSDKSEN